jgi:protein-S-isoprenylcysteine O-methyltransferase Ste14
MRVLAAVRTAIYVTGFVLLWGWLALSVRRYDTASHIVIPAWVTPLGLALTAVGAAVGLSCVFLFATQGRGTPAPFDPPREFVATGPYRFVRNPMYIGGLLVLGGFGLMLRSPCVLLLAVASAVLVHLFVVLVEEPGLEWRFGDRYHKYKRSVHRWVPRRPRTPGD